MPPLALSLLLLAIVLLGFYLRSRYWLVAGGLEAAYGDWAVHHHHGSIAETNLANARSIYDGKLSNVHRSYPPGYPALIALAKFVGVSDPQLYRLVQAALDAGASILAYAVVRKLGAGQVAATVGAGAYAVAPSWAWGSTLIMSESLLPALTLAALLAFLSVVPRRDAASWFLAGFVLGLLPMFRPEMTLLVIPWVLWAGLSGGPGSASRLALAVAAFCGFAVPWNSVALYNYATHGQYFITDNITGYALFCGLGQIPNPHGYFVDDLRAGELLRSLGLKYRSWESEQYWRAVYWNAWREHPGHVLETLLFRMKLILFQSDIAYPYFKRLRDLGDAGPYLLVCACALLARRRQYARILIVAGPLLYAMASNGLIYVELRYVRYAHLSYLLAGCLLLDGLLVSLRRVARRHLDSSRAGHVARIAVIAAAVPVCAWAARESYALHSFAERTAIAMGLRDAPNHGREIAAGAGWRPVDGARVEVRNGAPVVTTSAKQGYQADYEIDTSNVDALAVKFSIAVVGVPSYFHLSNRDKSFHYATGDLPANSEASKRLLTAVEPPRAFFVLATAAAGGGEIAVRSLQYRPLCAHRRAPGAQSRATWLRSILLPLPADFSPVTCRPAG